MKQITREMLKIYKPISNMDWLNYKLVKIILKESKIDENKYYNELNDNSC